MGIENRIGVSTATFLDLSSPVAEGRKIVSSYLKGEVYAPEVHNAMVAARKLGIGAEVVYRRNIQRMIPWIRATGVSLLQIHGPISFDVMDSVRQSLSEHPLGEGRSALLNLVESPTISKFALGTFKEDWNANVELAEILGVSQIVVHPHGARELERKGMVELARHCGISLAIEPDFKRLRESPYIVWNPREVLGIAENIGEGVCMDTSHTIITFNNTDALSKVYGIYKQSPKGVKAIHVSAAVPGEHRQAFFTQATGAMPLYQDESIVPSFVRGAYADFVQEVANDPDFDGPIIIELFSFPKGGSFDQRVKAVEETLESLLGFVSHGGSISLPGKPTARPL